MNHIHENLPAITPPFFTVFDYIIIGVFLVGVIIILWKLFSSPKKAKKISAPEKPMPEIFVPPVFHLSKEIEKLEQLADQEDWKKFSLSATQVLKKICEKKWKQPFDFATGKEIRELLREKISSSERTSLSQFFHLLDPIKFAAAEGKAEISGKIISMLKTL